MERMDQLWPGGPRYYYDDAYFPPGTDSFLLGAFPRLRPGERVCDLGCGTGLLGLLMLAREPSLHVTGVDIQPGPLSLARKSAAESHFDMSFLQADLRHPEQLPPAGSFDLVVCNPPYFKPDSGFAARGQARRIARAEEAASLEEVCAAAARLLRWGGRLALVYRPERLCDLMCALRGCGIEPKRLRWVESRIGTAPSLLLLEGRRGGGSGLTTEPPLVLRDQLGRDTPEVDAIYFRNRTTEDAPL